MKRFVFLLWLCLPFATFGQNTLQQGQVISRSVSFSGGVYDFSGAKNLDSPVLTITGENLTIDFGGAILRGSPNVNRPDSFGGLGILIKNGKNIHLKNLAIRGYKVALMAENVEGLVLEDLSLSYNYRPKLKSQRTRENIDDWLSFHQNEKDEWLNYGMALYLKDCQKPTIRRVEAQNGFNGLMLMRVNDGLIYNNNFSFNSGLGIGMYRSSRNRILHNRLDWNVRGYSHGFYQRGQDSAGILIYEQSNENIFAYNSATHSGDGFFLWAGQSTMDTGQGGCNDNLLYRNDFSHAPTNGIEVTFSRSIILQNRIHECDHGIWGGYSFESLVQGNDFADNRIAIAIEHGQFNNILNNSFQRDQTAIRLWQREKEPEDWIYAQKRDTRNRHYHMTSNRFTGHKTVLEVERGQHLRFYNNKVTASERFVSVKNATSADILVYGNGLSEVAQWGTGLEDWQSENKISIADFSADLGLKGLRLPNPLSDGMDAMLPANHPRGRKFILMTAYGPYNFGYPHIRLDSLSGDVYRFSVLGKAGQWRVQSIRGLKNLSAQTGRFPAEITAERASGNEVAITLAYTGPAFETAFGEVVSANQIHLFETRWIEPAWRWDVHFFAYDEASHPLKHPEAFRQILDRKPIRSIQTRDLGYNWWRSPENDAAIPPDRFATRAETTFDAKGSFNLQITSDDGVRVWLDDKLILERWDIHVPTTDVVPVILKGKHKLRVEHFEGGGFACLDVQLVER
ncbi:MAG: right-handed parallel beta-helix repeat-containing protein [Bacteroidetes Order II. Incertae sedis bacterium]|nr:right-handed parallel beta-helix repeat-containing protein [Bacteroidetes Order II. bacterium]